MINWPEDVVEDIARRRCVLYLGSGVSANSVNEKGETPATWGICIRKLRSPKCVFCTLSKFYFSDLLNQHFTC